MKWNSVFSLYPLALVLKSESRYDVLEETVHYLEAWFPWQQAAGWREVAHHSTHHSTIHEQDDAPQVIYAYGLLAPPSWERQKQNQGFSPTHKQRD